MENFPAHIEELLERNYEFIRMNDGLECMKFALDFITSTQSVLDMDPISIKCLTKVASHIINSDHYTNMLGLNSSEKLIPFLEKVYWFNIDGASNIEFSDINRDSELKEKIKSHFLSHAAKIASKLFDNTNELNWAINCYNAEISSAKISENLDKFHSSHAYAYAADIGKKIYSLTKDIKWAKKSYDAQMYSAKLSEPLDTRFCGLNLDLAANLACILLESTNDLDWAKQAYDCSISSAKLLTHFKPASSAYSYYKAGKVAQNIYDLTKEAPWKEKATTAYNNCISEVKKFGLDNIFHLIPKSERGIKKLNGVQEEQGSSSIFSLKEVLQRALSTSSQ
jgi:hypothetical protein